MDHEVSAIAPDSDGNGDGTALRCIAPNLPKHVLGKLSAFIEVKTVEGDGTLGSSLRHMASLWEEEEWSVELRAVSLLLSDLLDQGWDVTAEGSVINLKPPGLRITGETPDEAKRRLRRALHMGRDRQLADAGVRKFLERMHRPVIRGGRRSSIADVIDSGSRLAESLRPFAGLPTAEAAGKLKCVIDPIVEVCEEGAKCSVTGLRLIDIWRYFRHTWSLEYRSTPGRQMGLLIRNAALPMRPVMGIAMLASPVVRMRVRDDWIGWNPEPFVRKLQEGVWDCDVALRSLVERLERSIGEIRWDDLVSPDEIAFPSERTILRLEQRCAGAASARMRQLEDVYTEAESANEAVRSQRDDAHRGNLAQADWRAASEDPLFLRKRAETLGRLLDAKRTFQAVDWTLSSRALLEALLGHPGGWRAIGIAMVELRKAGLSSQVADVSVCGAVAPYGGLLVGKLVGLLMASREVREAYRRRYATQVSVISSQMAGRVIHRPAELKVLTTTSLYGNGSSQYNRLRLRASEFPKLAHDVEWRELAKTAGFGTVHLGASTARVLREVSERLHRARRINHRFGEGASPRLRQIREAVEALGIDASSVLHHATPRIFYGCQLHPGAIQELLGLRPMSEDVGPSVADLAHFWRTRWLAGRIKSDTVLESLCMSDAESLERFFAAKAGRSEDGQQ